MSPSRLRSVSRVLKTAVTDEALKACCADLYASDWARLLLGESLHPGGLGLTEQLAHLLELDADRRVLDLAAGRGASALHLARTFGCKVIGVDYSTRNVALARDAADASGLAEQVQFYEGDAERLTAFPECSFDAVLCECAYCTFPDKAAAAREITRVLRPGARFGLSDLTRTGPLAPELQGILAWVACIADALPVEQYITICQTAGLEIERVEEHDQVLAEVVHQIRGRLAAAEVLAKLRSFPLPAGVADELGVGVGVGERFQEAKLLARRAAAAVESHAIGYALIVAAKPLVPPQVRLQP